MKQKNNRKCAAMIMKRHYIEKDSYIYSCDYTALGEIDTSTGIFYDRNGKGYKSVVNSLDSLEPDAYYWIIELSKLKEEYPAYSQRESLKEFENDCKKDVCFAYKAEDGLPVTVIQSLEEWRDLRFDGEKDEFEEGEDEYTKLVEEVVNNKYTIRDLKKIKENLLKQQEGIESAIESVNIYIEARQGNQSYLEYYEKKLKKLEEEAKEIEKEKNTTTVEKQQEIEKKPQIEEKKKLDIEELFNKVTKTLIAQDEAARRVIVEIARKEMDERKKKEAILITGPTGVGKTELMRLIAKYIDRPFIKVDSTQLTVPGYVGKDIEEVLWDLYIQCDRNLEKTERAIVYFDEIDKKGSSKKSDVSGQGVLNVLLPFIEGSTYDACSDLKNSMNKVKINTSNMIITLGGAYTDVYKNLLEKNSIGFGGNIYDKPTYREATTKDFVDKGGMTDEFMGRVTVVPLDALDVDGIKRVMLESDESQIKIQEKIFEKLNTKITFTDGCLTKVAKNAIEKKTGARGLNGIIDSITWKAFDEVYTNPGKYKEVIITEDTIDDASNFQLVKKRGRKKKND